MSAFPGAADSPSFAAICAEHAQVMPADVVAPWPDESDRQRAIALLQQQARALAHEVQAREQAQELLRHREAELSDFVEEVPIALHWVGPDGTILWANRAEYEWLGYQREEYIGHHFTEFHADRAVAEEMLSRLARHETLQDFEAQMRRKDGSCAMSW